MDVQQIISEYKQKSLEEQKAFCKELKKKIQYIDSLPSNKDYEYRNEMVEIKRELQRHHPFEFAIGEKVIMHINPRDVKGVVIAHGDPAMRMLTVRPVDNVYKETLELSESFLESEEKKEEIEEEQMCLF